jgi:hypothetical protein
MLRHLEEVLATKDRLVWPSPWITLFFLPRDSLRVGERRFDQVVTKLYRLTGSIYQHAIGTFNTYSWGSTHRSLTDTDGGYNLEGAGFSHHTLRPSQMTVLCFSPKGPTWSQVIQVQHKPLAIKIKAHSHRVAFMPLDLYRTLQLHLVIANGLQLLKWVVKDNTRGITKMQLWYLKDQRRWPEGVNVSQLKFFEENYPISRNWPDAPLF